MVYWLTNNKPVAMCPAAGRGGNVSEVNLVDTVRPCEYLNERWYSGWGTDFRERACGRGESDSFETRCVKPQKWGGAALKLDEKETGLCKATTSSRCWRKH